MKIEIDQSGKIEETAKDTILALSNDKQFSIKLRAEDKKIIQFLFRAYNRQKVFIYLTFSALIFLLLKEVRPKTKVYKVYIDQEYPGQEKLIRTALSNFGYKNNYEFRRVGKSSSAHGLAHKTYQKKIKADKTITLENILNLILPNKKDRVSRY